MKPFINKYIMRGLFSLLAACCVNQGLAQLHENINVEGKYVPDIIRADRINIFPQALKPSLAVRALSYDNKGVAAGFSPDILTLPATGWRASRKFDTSKGYIDLGSGSHLNTNLSAGYRFLNQEDSKAGVRLQFNSISLWKPFGDFDKNKYRYDGAIGFYGSHRVDDLGTFDASLDWHTGYFDYYWISGPEIDLPLSVKAPTQTLTDVRLNLGWSSQRRPETLFYSAGLNISHFGFRSLPMPQLAEPTLKGGRETTLRLTGNVGMPWYNGSTIGLDADLDIHFLNCESPELLNGQEASNQKIDNYALLNLTPNYRFARGLLDIRLGVNLDMAFNAGFEGNRYSFLHLSPDVRLGWQQGQAGLYLNLTGGSEANSLSRLHQLDYYNVPTILNTRPEFTPLDAAFGVNLGPFSGFSIGLEGRWKKTDNIFTGGWYQYWLAGGDSSLVIDTPLWLNGRKASYLSGFGMSLHGFSISGSIGYEYGNLFKLSAKGSWQPQKEKEGFFNGYDRPEITLEAGIEGAVTRQLHLGAGINYRGKRSVWTQTLRMPNESDFITCDFQTNAPVPMGAKLDNLTLLNVNASWHFNPDMSIWVQGSNLLDRKDDYLPMQPLPGIGVTAGFSWKF